MQQVPLNQIIFLFYWITTLRPPLPLEPLGSKQCAAVIDKARKKAFKGSEFAKLQMLSAFETKKCSAMATVNQELVPRSKKLKSSKVTEDHLKMAYVKQTYNQSSPIGFSEARSCGDKNLES